MYSPLSKKIIRTILYFDIFNHPIKKQEIVDFTSKVEHLSVVNNELKALIESGVIYEFNNYYSARPDFGNLINKRMEGERIAQAQYGKALSRAKLIGQFPYVRAAYISGSMSKGVMPEDGDVDYFIITEPGRLWLARTFLILFKKTFLFNSRKFFCLNYFIDSDNLEIEEKNIFTATEVVTLKPIYDSGVYERFRQANKWVNEYIPNGKDQQIIYNKTTSRPIASFVEKLLNNQLGDKMDEWLMSATLKVWRGKFNYMNELDFDVALKTRKYVSKHHPQNFQSMVLQALQSRVQDFEDKHQVKLS